jgi:hypothetical protein
LPAHAASVVYLEIESSKNGESKGTNTNIITIDEKKFRLDYLDTENKKTKTTPFLSTLNDGKDWVLADQKDNKFYCARIDMNDFFRDLGDIMWNMNSLANPKFSETKVELLAEEPGPEMSGYATTHLRFQTTARINARVLLKKFEYGMTKTDDIWYTKEREIHPARKRWIEALTHSGYDQIDQLSSELRSKIPGAILKQDSIVKITDYKKDKVDTYERKVRVVSVKELKSSELPEDTFTSPKCDDLSDNQINDMAKSIFKEGRLTL